MPWVKIDEHFYDHPKWADAPGDSIAQWLAMLAWCNRNDSRTGFIPDAKTRGLVNVKRLRKTLEDLCERQAIHPVSGGYIIHDYGPFQQPDKVREIAEKRSVAGKKGAAMRWGERARAAEYNGTPLPSDGEANGMASAIAKTCPDTDTGSEGLTSTETNITSRVPDHPVDKSDDWGPIDLEAWRQRA